MVEPGKNVFWPKFNIKIQFKAITEHIPHLFAEVSQSLIVRSLEPEATDRPELKKRAVDTLSEWPVNVYWKRGRRKYKLYAGVWRVDISKNSYGRREFSEPIHLFLPRCVLFKLMKNFNFALENFIIMELNGAGSPDSAEETTSAPIDLLQILIVIKNYSN